MKIRSPKPFYLRKLFKVLALLLATNALSACDNQIPDFIDELREGSEDVVCDDDVTSIEFKQIAYWSVSDEETLDDIDFSMLTHIIYNKIGVESDGDLIMPTGDDLDEFEEMIEKAQDNSIYAMVSIGNSSDSAFNSIAASDTALDNFRDNLEDLISDYDLDGIDINWQFPEDDDEGDLFEDLIKEMDDLAADKDVLFSYVVDTGQDDDATDDGVQDDTLDYGDFLNVMALETTDDDDLHSSLEDAEDAIAYWTGRCVVKNRLVLAIPAYSEGDEILDFSEIVEDDLDYACTDESEGRNYNGIPTVITKTEFAQSYAGGVILTSLEQDYFDDTDYSLLNTIYTQAIYSSNSICN